MNYIHATKTDKWRLYGVGEPRECCSREEAEFLMLTYGYQTAEASCGRYQLLLPKNMQLTLTVRRLQNMWRVMYPPYVFPGEWKLRKDAMNWIRDTFDSTDKTVTDGIDLAYVTIGKAEKTP